MGTEARKKPPGTEQILSGIVQSTLYLSKSVCFVVVLRIQYSLFYVIIELGKSGVKNGIREERLRTNSGVGASGRFLDGAETLSSFYIRKRRERRKPANAGWRTMIPRHLCEFNLRQIGD